VSNVHRFAVVDGGAPERLVAGLERLPGVEVESTRSRISVVHDTFDWRVHRAGGTLVDVREGRRTSLVWSRREGGEELARWTGCDAPRFVWDLPSGPANDRLAAVVEMRALLPLVTVHSTVSTLRVLGDEDKTVARIVVDAAELVPASEAVSESLGTVVEVVSLRGYAKAAERVAAHLAERDDLRPGGEDLVVRAVRAAGLEPGSYSSKLRLALDPGAAAVDAWVEVLATLFATMADNHAGTVADIDSEFLHDFRVAVRRTRSVLGEAKGVLPVEALARFRAEFKWLGDVTTPTRDFDVYRLTLPSFVEGLPVDRRDDLAPFATFLAAHQRSAQRQLAADLTSARYEELMADWQALLDDPRAAIASSAEPTPRAERAARHVAAARIWKAYRRLVTLGRAITDESPPTDLHELRKDGKRLRYLLECFGSLFPASEVEPLVKELKGLQDVLGEYQDCHVQIESLGHFGQEMLDEGGTDAAGLLAMGHLVDQIDRRQHEVRDHYAERFARFDRVVVRRRFRATFRPAARPGPEPRRGADVVEPQPVEPISVEPISVEEEPS
jgi:CHAD domain-containing protein